ncbi:MAG: glycosyltransferase family 4 protein [Thermoproteota archaeon]
MKLAFAMYDLGFGGGNRAIIEVANRLHDRGYDVNIVSLSRNKFWPNVKVPVINVKVPVIPAPIRMAVKLYRLLKYFSLKGIESYGDIIALATRLGIRVDIISPLAEAIMGLDPDVAIATWYLTAFSVWMSSVNTPLFFMQDFKEYVEETEGINGLKRFEAALKLPFSFLTNSTFTKDLVLSYNKNAKVTIVGVGVDLSIFHPRRGDRLVVSQGKPIVMAIIRRLKYKGGDIALRALNLINKEQPIHAVLVGEGSALDKYLKEVKPEFTYTKFTYVDDETLAKLYSSSDVFIFTSYREGFGLPPLEAMASGTAVVTTDCGGNRDYAIDGYNSFVVPPGDPVAVTKAVLHILRDSKLRERLIEGGLETAKKWTWDKVVDKFEKVLKSES